MCAEWRWCVFVGEVSEDGGWRNGVLSEVRLHGNMIMMRAVRLSAVSDNEAASTQVQECHGDRITFGQDKKH